MRIIVVLLWCAPAAVFPQTKLTITPQFDDSVTSTRTSFPHRIQKRPRVALVLSGGGARGVAQIGVLRALERHRIPIDLIAATSLGAIVGGLYAAGYTTAELESLALKTDWDDVLSLTEETKRTDLFIDQKLVDDRSFLVVRFEGLEPVIPSAVSTGQRLTNFLSTLTLQAPYHPNPSFDDLKIRFRAATTDLISGKRIVLKEGSLAEALRASATVPLLFSPIARDTMQLIDGGLVTNIPVDVARDEGCDIVIAVNSTSGLRNSEELKAPWQTADQIMGIMMQLSNEQQLRNADIAITPDIGKHLSSDFRGLDTLIRAGEAAAESVVGKIRDLYDRLSASMVDGPDEVFSNVEVERKGVPDSIWTLISDHQEPGVLSVGDIRRHIRTLYDTGDLEDVRAEIFSDSSGTRVLYTAAPGPHVESVELVGCQLVSAEVLRKEILHLLGKPVNHRSGEESLENILRIYRAHGYSLARFDSVSFDVRTGTLRVTVNEGVIHKIEVRGKVRTQDYYVLREFPLEEGEVFEIEKARRGITNINSTNLFEYVYLEVSYIQDRPVLTIRLKERPTQLVRFGLRADSERNLQGAVDLRDENFYGTGAELGFSFSGGGRNTETFLEYKARRLFDTYLTFNVRAFYSTFDSYVYGDAPDARPNRWSRVQLGEYRDIRYGGRLVFGSQLERLGNTTLELSLQNARIRNLENFESLEERFTLALFRIGTVIDSKNSYPFPTAGVGLNIGYEFVIAKIDKDVAYNALKVVYESFITFGTRHTVRPGLTVGFADKTMPLGQQFRLGGRETFFGVREDDRRGRQMLLLNLEYRFRLPVRILLDTYLRVRYDLGSISTVPEEIKLSTFRHGVGGEIAFDSPFGPAMVGAGKSFYFVRDLPEHPIRQGPVIFYFMIGYQL